MVQQVGSHFVVLDLDSGLLCVPVVILWSVVLIPLFADGGVGCFSQWIGLLASVYWTGLVVLTLDLLVACRGECSE